MSKKTSKNKFEEGWNKFIYRYYYKWGTYYLLYIRKVIIKIALLVLVNSCFDLKKILNFIWNKLNLISNSEIVTKHQ